MKPIERITLLYALATLVYGCDSDRRLVDPGVSKSLMADASGVPSTEGLASPRWHETARKFITQSPLSGNSAPAMLVIAYFTVPQHDLVRRLYYTNGEKDPQHATLLV